jgi:glycine betaine/proline transport system ATP-binding protein
MGLSGSGKSTLIRHLNRIIEPTAGRVIVDGKNIIGISEDELREFRRYKASMVFQKFGLLPHRTVIQNVSYGLLIQGKNKVEANQIAQKWIDRVTLTGFENNYPHQMSGGMQQRVGLARALATDAGILLMDEAFSSLDPLIRTNMQDMLLDLQKELNKTIVFITHDINEAIRIGANISILRDGSIIQTGSPEDILLSPKDNYITDFIKDINRGRVLKLSSIMKKTNIANGPKILFNKSIEEALPIIASASDSSAVIVDEKGKTLGTVSLDKVIAAISNNRN